MGCGQGKSANSKKKRVILQFDHVYKEIDYDQNMIINDILTKIQNEYFGLLPDQYDLILRNKPLSEMQKSMSLMQNNIQPEEQLAIQLKASTTQNSFKIKATFMQHSNDNIIVWPGMLILHLKFKIQKFVAQIPLENQILKFNGDTLIDTNTIEQYNIKQGDELIVDRSIPQQQ